jgi:hypothetical protein
MAPIRLPLGGFLSPAGLAQLKIKLDQALANSAQTVFLVLEQFTDEEEQAAIEIVVEVLLQGGEYIIQNTDLPTVPAPAWVQGVASKIKELRIKLNQTGDTIVEFVLEMETELESFRENVQDKLAKIPYRVEIQNGASGLVFQIVQTNPILGRINQTALTLNSSSLTFTGDTISQLAFAGELTFEALQETEGQPYTANVSLSYANDQLTVTGQGFPPAKLSGHDFQLQQFMLILKNNQFMPGSNVQGQVTFNFLDSGAQGLGTLDLTVAYQNNGDVLYSAQNPEGYEFKKGAISLFFSRFEILDPASGSVSVNIEGWFQLAGVKSPVGEPIQTQFTLGYNNSHFHFTGVNLAPTPIGLGTLNFTTVLLKIHENGTVPENNWLGRWYLPEFDQGALDFEINYLNDGNRTLTIDAQNPQATPLQMGRIELTLSALSLEYQNGVLQNATGNGTLVLPNITEGDPIDVAVSLNRVNQLERFVFQANGINGKEIAGADLNLNLVKLTYLNNNLEAADIEGMLKLPDANNGADLEVDLDLSNGGEDYTLALKGGTQDKELNFGPVQLTFNDFTLVSTAGAITAISGSGALQLQGLDDAFDFDFTADPSQDPIDYRITVNNLQSSLNGMALHFNTLTLLSNSAQPFQLTADGTLRLPLFTDGAALGFTLQVEPSYSYVLTAQSAQSTDLLMLGDTALGAVDLSITVDNGAVTSFAGSASLTIPGFDEAVAVSLEFDGSQDRYDLTLTNPAQTSLAGNEINLTTYNQIIVGGALDSASGQGNLKLPDSTGGAGINFFLNLQPNGRDVDLTLTGNQSANTLEFGEVRLEFNAFELLIRSGEVSQVSGSGDLTLPGLSQAFSFALSADFTNPQAPQYRILVQSLGADLGSFNLQFEQIEIISVPGSQFSAAASGELTLSALSGSPLNFTVDIRRSANYFVDIDGTGKTLSYGPVQLHDLDLLLDVDDGTLQNASGSAKVAINGLSIGQQKTTVAVTYTALLERFQLSVSQAFPLTMGPVELTVQNFDFTLLSGAFSEGTLSGKANLPVFGGGTALNFALALSEGGSSFTGSLNSSGILTANGLKLKEIAVDLTLNNGSLSTAQGSAKINTTLQPSTEWTDLDVSYAADTFNFSAQSLPAITLGGLVFQFSSFGFSLTNGQLTNGNLGGSVTLPGFESSKNSFDFSYTLSQTNQHRFTVSYPAASPLHLKKGDVDIYLRQLEVNTTGANVDSASGDLDFSIEGLQDPDDPSMVARIGVGVQYQNAQDNFNFTLSNTPELDLGGFKFSLNTLEVNIGSGGLQYPFTFDGELTVPGLKNSSGGDAELGIALTVTGPNNFSGTISASAATTFNFGSLELRLNALSIAKNGSVLAVELRGELELTAFTSMGGDPAVFTVEVGLDSAGNFSILGEEPSGNGVKVADIPGVVRLYLSKLGLSQAGGEWDFALGGLIQNQIVLPGMEELLPSEINLKDLQFGSSFDLDMDLRWPSGLSINIGGEVTEALIPVNGKFGQAVSLEALRLSFSQLPGNGGATLGIAFSGATLRLGPVVATVEGLGVEATITKANTDAEGNVTEDVNFGVVNVEVEFKPPEGLGVAVNTPVFTGGGYLYFNHEKEEYAGALELSFMDLFAVSAIGLINNKMPDGQPGTSVLFIISVEFTPGIALGFGFFISGLGGILGVHRTIQVDRLRDGVQNGTIQNILFPQNIIANITRIISDIKEVFPIARNQFVVGPMAAITWGVPTIVRVDLGLAIEIGTPTKFAILGVLRVILPDESLALVRLQVAFLGVLDLEQKMLSFDASLFDSKILTFGMEGDMALRIGWGDKPDFVITMGGFHPSFSPPTHLKLPSLKRLTLKILSGNPRLTLTSYFAVTSNTVQFGAGIDFYFGVAGFKIVGEFGFDVLFQFSPFRFIADARARLAVKAGSTTLLSLSLTFTLEGPTPWRAKGSAKFKVLFFSVKVRFDETWGDKRETTLPDIAVLPLLREALEDNQNWRSVTGPNHMDGLRMRAPENTEDLILTPNGYIELSQKVVPLNAPISKFGQFNPADYTQFGISEARVGSSQADLEPVFREFAPANFLAVSDTEKLALPSFEQQEAGVKITAQGGLKCGNVVDRQVKYETSIMDEELEVLKVMRSPETVAFPASESTFFSLRGAVGQSAFSATTRQILNPAKVQLKKRTYAVVDTDDFTVQNTAMGAAQNLSFLQAQEVALQNNSTQIVSNELVNS